MRHLEVHVIETEHDVDLAIQAGLITADQLNHSACAECGDPVGHASSAFEQFAIVLDELNEDWAVCMECSAPVLDSATSYLADDDFDDSDLELF